MNCSYISNSHDFANFHSLNSTHRAGVLSRIQFNFTSKTLSVTLTNSICQLLELYGSFSPGMLWMVMARMRRRIRRQLLPVRPTPSCCLLPVSCPSELPEWGPLLLWYTSPFSILSAWRRRVTLKTKLCKHSYTAVYPTSFWHVSLRVFKWASTSLSGSLFYLLHKSYLCVQPSETLWMPLKRDYLKECAIIPICMIETKLQRQAKDTEFVERSGRKRGAARRKL